METGISEIVQSKGLMIGFASSAIVGISVRTLFTAKTWLIFILYCHSPHSENGRSILGLMKNGK